MMRMRDFKSAVAVLNRRKRGSRPPPNPGIPSTLPNGMARLAGRPSIDRMREWLAKIGHGDDDLDRLNVVHIAGTKGKGSTCAFVESLLRAHGQRTGFPRKTGLYTSPHLMDVSERIRINFAPLPEHLFAEYVFEVCDGLGLDGDGAADQGPRYLQLLALVALHAFVREGVDVAILETHHGGRFDATNVVPRPVVTGITSIGLDHVHLLGPSIEHIAQHKAGIFKPGALAFSAPQQPAVARVLLDQAAKTKVPLVFTAAGSVGSSKDQPETQRTNLELALAISNAVLRQRSPDRFELAQTDIAEGVRHFRWPGRFEILRRGPETWFLDGAHNEMSMPKVAEWFEVASSGESSPASAARSLIFAQMSDQRDGQGVLRRLAESLKIPMDKVIFTSYQDMDHGPDEGKLLASYARAWREIVPGSTAHVVPSVADAVGLARDQARPGQGSQVLVTGSLHLVGEVMRLLEQG